MELRAKNSRTINAECAGALSCGESIASPPTITKARDAHDLSDASKPPRKSRVDSLTLRCEFVVHNSMALHCTNFLDRLRTLPEAAYCSYIPIRTKRRFWRSLVASSDGLPAYMPSLDGTKFKISLQNCQWSVSAQKSVGRLKIYFARQKCEHDSIEYTVLLDNLYFNRLRQWVMGLAHACTE